MVSERFVGSFKKCLSCLTASHDDALLFSLHNGSVSSVMAVYVKCGSLENKHQRVIGGTVVQPLWLLAKRLCKGEKILPRVYTDTKDETFRRASLTVSATTSCWVY